MNITIDVLSGLIAPIAWSDVKPPTADCYYNHITAETPLGNFLITWKSWKENYQPTVDQTPWGDWYVVCDSVEDAMLKAEAEYKKRILSTFNLGKPSLVPSPDWSASLPTEIGDYFVSCDETKHVPVLVEVIRRFAYLAVKDSNIGIYPIDIYSGNLSNPSWSKAIPSN